MKNELRALLGQEALKELEQAEEEEKSRGERIRMQMEELHMNKVCLHKQINTLR